MTRLRWLFFALALVGGLTLLFGQMRERPRGADPAQMDDQRPDAYLSGYRVRFYRPSGDLHLDFGGKQVTHHTSTRINRAEAPSLTYHDADNRLWTMQAETAIYPFAGNVFTLTGAVRITQMDVGTRTPEFLLTTRDLVYYPHSRRIFTPSLVTARSPQGEWTALGIEGDLGSRRFVFQSQVQGIFRHE